MFTGSRGAEQGHNTVAHDLIRGVLTAMHRFHHALQHQLQKLAPCSGLRSASNSIEPFRSARSASTWLRSLASAARDVRIFPAK